MSHETRKLIGRPPLYEDQEIMVYRFKDHPDLRDDLDRAVADLQEDGIKANRSMVMRALIHAQRDHMTDITREYLGHESELM